MASRMSGLRRSSGAIPWSGAMRCFRTSSHGARRSSGVDGRVGKHGGVGNTNLVWDNPSIWSRTVAAGEMGSSARAMAIASSDQTLSCGETWHLDIHQGCDRDRSRLCDRARATVADVRQHGQPDLAVPFRYGTNLVHPVQNQCERWRLSGRRAGVYEDEPVASGTWTPEKLQPALNRAIPGNVLHRLLDRHNYPDVHRGDTGVSIDYPLGDRFSPEQVLGGMSPGDSGSTSPSRRRRSRAGFISRVTAR